MIDHGRALDLAAAELDFALAPADEAALTAHLATCDACSRVAHDMRDDAAALRGLDREDAPVALRSRLMETIGISDADGDPSPEPAPRAQVDHPIRFRLPPRYHRPALLAAAAAVVIAVVGGTLAWRTGPDGDVAMVDPSHRPVGSAEAPGELE